MADVLSFSLGKRKLCNVKLHITRKTQIHLGIFVAAWLQNGSNSPPWLYSLPFCRLG